jgi:hypothetical protein
MPRESSIAEARPMDIDSQLPARWTEVLILVHGISPEANPKPPDQVYDEFLVSLNEALPADKQFDDTSVIRIVWGLGKDSLEGGPFDNLSVDEYLAAVERRLAGKVAPVIQEQEALDPLGLLSPGRLVRRLARRFRARDMLLQVIPDLFYYVSADGEKVIRNRIFRSIGENIMHRREQAEDQGISLTVVGHSAGSVIAHDFLYHVFGRPGTQAQANTWQEGTVPEVMKLREELRGGQLRLRRLYTFGSPITAMMFRANSLVKRMMEDTLIDPEDIGLRVSDNLVPATPRWVNFWDVDDYASFPVTPFYRNDNGVIEDRCADRNRQWRLDLLPASHLWYWHSQEVVNYIAETF